MPEDRERVVLSAVALALQQPPEQRLAILAVHLAEDSEARAEAESILSFETRSTIVQQRQPVLRHFAAGEMLGRFRIVRLIGSGGMGDVYEAEDTGSPAARRRALKTIRADISHNADLAEQFKREIELGQVVTHPNVCRVFDLGQQAMANGNTILFLTMELLQGKTLAQRLKDRGPLAPNEALPILRQVAAALMAAHTRKVVHRDLKPGNIMLVDAGAGSPPRAVVTDFGLAVELSDDSHIAMPGPRSGTPDYMSPEQVQCGPVGCESDIYSLAVVAYEMVTGRFPFDGESAKFRMAQRLHADPVPPSARRPGLVPDWSAPLLRALSRDPAKRYASAECLVDALTDPKAENAAQTETLKPEAPPERRRWMTGAALLFLLVLAGFVLRRPVQNLLHPLPGERRIAVLPFENIGDNEAERAFIDGLTQTLISELTELEPLQGSLSIVPSLEVHKQKVTTPHEANLDFGVTLAVTGSVERTRRGIHIIVNLVDAKQVKQLRSQNFYVNPDEPVEMQQEVVRHVADILQLAVHPQTLQKFASNTSASPAAYDFYLRGSGYLTQRAGADQAVTEFKLALQQDPNYALAHAGLCEAYWQKYKNTSNRDWITTASKECESALALNASLARPHVALAILDVGTGKYKQAIREAKIALAADPGSDSAHLVLAGALDKTGQSQEAEAILVLAVKMRSGDASLYLRLADFYMGHARYAEAITQYQRAIALMPDNPAGYTNLGAAYLENNQLEQAEEVLKRSIALKPTYAAVSNLATLYFHQGRYAASVPIFEQATRLDKTRYTVWGNLGDALRWTPGKAAQSRSAYQEAIALAKDALAVNTKDGAALSSTSLYRAKSGDVHGALISSAQAVKLDPANPEFLFDAAVVSEIAHQRSAAIDYLGRALRSGYSLGEVKAEPELAELRKDLNFRLDSGLFEKK